MNQKYPLNRLRKLDGMCKHQLSQSNGYNVCIHCGEVESDSKVFIPELDISISNNHNLFIMDEEFRKESIKNKNKNQMMRAPSALIHYRLNYYTNDSHKMILQSFRVILNSLAHSYSLEPLIPKIMDDCLKLRSILKNLYRRIPDDYAIICACIYYEKISSGNYINLKTLVKDIIFPKEHREFNRRRIARNYLAELLKIKNQKTLFINPAEYKYQFAKNIMKQFYDDSELIECAGKIAASIKSISNHVTASIVAVMIVDINNANIIKYAEISKIYNISVLGISVHVSVINQKIMEINMPITKIYENAKVHSPGKRKSFRSSQ